MKNPALHFSPCQSVNLSPLRTPVGSFTSWITGPLDNAAPLTSKGVSLWTWLIHRKWRRTESVQLMNADSMDGRAYPSVLTHRAQSQSLGNVCKSTNTRECCALLADSWDEGTSPKFYKIPSTITSFSAMAIESQSSMSPKILCSKGGRFIVNSQRD